jgi:3-dehydroquinate dehydratase-2
MNLHIEYHQSNHEGVLIDWIQALNHVMEHSTIDSTLEDPIGIVLNAGGYTHTSVSLRDAVAMSKIPVVEVHISNILTREPFRQNSLLTDVCQHSIMGIGTQCYQKAVNYLISQKKA